MQAPAAAETESLRFDWVEEAKTTPESVILVLQGTSAADHPGDIDGYERLRGVGAVRDLAVFPVFGPAGVSRGNAFWHDVLEHAHDVGATLVVFHYYHSDQLPDPRTMIAKLRVLPSSPTIVTTLGDPFMNGYLGRPRVPRSFLAAASASDLVTLTSMGVLADYIARHTDAPLLLLPHSLCQVRFGKAIPAAGTEDVEFDVAFVGSRNRSRNPVKGYYWLGRRRERMVEQLTRRHGRRFAVFGHGWDHLESSQGPVPFHEQVSAIRRARIVVGGIPFSRARYYTSNRPFIQATSGVPIVDTKVPGVETLLGDGKHWLLADDTELVSRVEQVLEMPAAEREIIGTAAAQYVLERHTQAHRVAALVENARRLRRANLTGDPTPPHLPYFLDEVDPEAEGRFAVRNWPGHE